MKLSINTESYLKVFFPHNKPEYINHSAPAVGNTPVPSFRPSGLWVLKVRNTPYGQGHFGTLRGDPNIIV